MNKKPAKRAGQERTIRDQRDRNTLSAACEWWDNDKEVSLVAFAIRDNDHDDDARTKALVIVKPHHGIEIIYQVAKLIECKCGEPDCHINKCAAAVMAVLEMQKAELDGKKAALN